MRQGYLKRVRARLAKDMARVIAAGLVASLSGQALAQAGGDAASAQQQQQPLRTQADGSWRYYPNIPKAPKGAPNVLLVLTDDVGFGASSTFGGPIPTPNFDMLARNGLKYTQFHTTAMCSPTRASLLTGRNHHAVGSGSISNVSVDEPGYTSVIPDSAATLGQVLKNNGYDTAWFGKNHNTPDWELGPMGPFTHWPSGMGFDYFYGFNAAGTDQANPPLLENHIGVRRDPNDPNYIFEKDMADHLLAWMSAQNGSNPDKPFFAYYAPGAMHGPQQAPKEWIDKFKGKFDMGWDVVREQILARQKKMGVVAPDTKLAPPLPGVPAWSSLSSDQKRLYARMMEVAAAQLAYTDDQFGRIIARLKDTGQLDNTLIIFIQGDNGPALHNLRGTNNVYSLFAGIEPSDEDMLKDIDRLGSEHVLSNYPVGWGYATNTPFPWGKTVASKLGGLRDGMVISWPKGIADKGGVRTQFSHVIDIAPTIYEAIGIAPPEKVNGVVQQPIDGVALNYTFKDAKAPTRHREQYFEMLGSRAYYKDGWLAGTDVNWKPWGPNKTNPYKATWQLYNLNNDYSQTVDVSAKYPEKLAELRADFDKAAAKFNIYPLSADFFERINSKFRPPAIEANVAHVYYPSDIRYPAAAFPELTPGWEAVAKVTVQGMENGPILNQGGVPSGYALSLENGVPVFTYNPSGRAQERRTVKGGGALAPGTHEISVAFVPADKGFTLTMKVDGKVTQTAPVDRIIRILAGEAIIGRPALDDRTGPRTCGCEIEKVTVGTAKSS